MQKVSCIHLVSNGYGQCGVSSEINCMISPKRLLMNEEIKTIQCGGHHTIITSKSGQYYSCG